MKRFDTSSQAVIMCGISGSGKTQFARKLEEYGYIRLSVDALIWNNVGDKLSDLSSEDRRRLFIESNKKVQEQLVELLNSGINVVVDATHCRRSKRDDIRKICTKAGVKPVFVYCFAEKNELWRRLSQRKGLGPDDLIVSQEDLIEYWNGFERPQEDETDFIEIEHNAFD